MKSKGTGILLALCAASGLAAPTPAIIPQPQKMEVKEGAFKLSPDTRIYTDPASAGTGDFIAARLRKSTGYHLQIRGIEQPDAVVNGGLVLTTQGADTALGAEGYELSVTKNAVVIRAPTQAGLFYGVQTLLQLLPPQIFSTNVAANADWQIPCVEITDRPRFPWRGLMLDVVRHFFNKGEVQQLLDAVALHKINVLHMHLTDGDPNVTDGDGWRIEIKKYPKLTQVGGWRSNISFNLDPKSSTAYGTDGRYGGFYTQDDIREIVAYATARHVTIVPEIEMPGHAGAALRSYPEFSCLGKPGPDVYCAGNDETFTFLENVLTEVFDLFPSRYIHIGGDEVEKDYWRKCELCQARMKKEGLKNEEELQSYFIRRMEKFINAHGRKIIGWSEILQGGLAERTTVMDWIGGGREAARQGHDVVMAPLSTCYFCFYQSQDHSTEPHLGNHQFLPLLTVYSFDPMSGLAPEAQKHILGAQGCVWTEWLPNLGLVEYMTFPRLSALAEVTWSPQESRNFDDFTRRLQRDKQRLELMGVNYRRETAVKIGEWHPAQITTTGSTLEWDVTKNVTAAGKFKVTLNHNKGECGIAIAWVALLEDGAEISRDTHTESTGLSENPHTGFTGSNPYTLDVPAPKAGARYTLRAQVAARAGTDSHGSVYWNLKPTTGK